MTPARPRPCCLARSEQTSAARVRAMPTRSRATSTARRPAGCPRTPSWYSEPLPSHLRSRAMPTLRWLPLLLLPAVVFAADPPPAPSIPPKSPREELATFRVAPGFRVELIAAEPEVIDPVAMAFDADGRLFVVEMRGYPNRGVGEGTPVLPGRVKLLEDKDG